MQKIIILMVFILHGCSFPHMPQTANEFKQTAPTTSQIQTETIYVDKSLEIISKRLNTKLGECFNFDSTWSRSQGGITKGSFTEKYRVRLVKNNNKMWDYTIQAEPTGNRIGPKMPEGGFYRIVIEIIQESSSKTKVSVYSAGWGEASKSILNWSKGLDSSCPVS